MNLFSRSRLSQRPSCGYLLGHFMSVSRSSCYEPHWQIWGQCMSIGGQKIATIHWIYNIKLLGKWEHRIQLLYYCIIMVVVLITATWQQQRHVMCVLERERTNDGTLSRIMLSVALQYFLVNIYLGMKVVKERLCIAGVVVWRWEGHR